MVYLCILQVHCCGVDSYADWGDIGWYQPDPDLRNAIPISCCAEVGGCGDVEYLELASNGGIVGDVKVWTTVSIRSNEKLVLQELPTYN